MKSKTTLAAGTLATLFLCAASPAFADGVDPAQATAEQRASAQTRFLKGRDLLKAGKGEEALAEFRASFDVVASPNARLYIARTLRDTGKLVAAYVEYGRTADGVKALGPNGAKYSETAATATTERTELEGRIALLTVTLVGAADGATLTIGAQSVERSAWGSAVPLVPGSVDVVLSAASGNEIARTPVTVAAGEKKQVTLDATPKAPPPPPTNPNQPYDPADLPPDMVRHAKPVAIVEPPRSGSEKLRPVAYVAGGIGILGLGTFAIAGAMEKSTFSSLTSSCHGVCPPDRAGDISSGKTQQLLANIGLGVGIVGVAAGVTLFVISMPRAKADPAAATAIVVSPSFIGVRGAL